MAWAGTNQRRRRLLALAALIGIAFVACSDGDDNGAFAAGITTSATASDTTGRASTEATVDSSTTTEATTSTTTTATAPITPSTIAFDPAAMRAGVTKARADGTVCGGRSVDFEVVTVHEFAGGALVAVPCDLFAYNWEFEFAVWDGELHPRTIPVYDPASRSASSASTVIATSVGSGQTYDVFTKGAGHGGCGTHANYRFAAGEIVIVDVRHYPCDGEPKAPEEWPVVYPN